MKKSKNFFKLEQKHDGKVFWNKKPIEALGETKISFKDQEYDKTPHIQAYFTNTKQTTKNMDNEDKLAVFNILKNIGFYSMKHTKG